VEVFYFALLVVSAFWLGACPFSVWIGQWVLGKDIRNYGDGNPGAANVFRAGGRKSGCLALILDVAKGAPFVALTHSFFTSWESLFMLSVFVLLAVKHFNELKTIPRLKVRLIDWLQSIRREI
jgi:glycerol-3-phosphate acyltransferase PlsY